jgi:phosphatidylinositol alpha-1,6-mannosyltransferase
MNIIVLSQHFLPMEGGSINWMLNSYSRLAPERTVFLVGRQPGEKAVDGTLPFPVVRMEMEMDDWDPTVPLSFRRYWKIFRRLGRLIKETDAAQVHCTKVFPEALAALPARWMLKTPYVVYAHGEEIITARMSRKLAALIGPVYRGASAVIANSKNTRRLLEDIGVPAGKIQTIHPGVDARRFSSEGDGENIRSRYGIGSAPLLLTVGRLQKRKGHDMAIRALAALRKRFPGVRYLIVGAGEEEVGLRSLAHDQGVSDAVVFAGKLPDEDLPGCYAACDVFIMANRTVNQDIEGFGMVFLEANAAGKPVIGGISGGTEDAIVDGETGFRVDAERPEAVATAIERLLADPELRKRMGRAGRRRVEREFSWDRVVQKTRRVAERVR